MQTELNEVEINGIKYVRVDKLVPMDMSKLSMVRSESAGVFFGMVESHDWSNGVVKMTNARRVWYWSGAASLSQLAMDGTSKPKECKFPCPVSAITIAKVIEVISMTTKAAQSLCEVPVWKQ
jgi:hypothetical protein